MRFIQDFKLSHFMRLVQYQRQASAAQIFVLVSFLLCTATSSSLRFIYMSTCPLLEKISDFSLFTFSNNLPIFSIFCMFTFNCSSLSTTFFRISEKQMLIKIRRTINFLQNFANAITISYVIVNDFNNKNFTYFPVFLIFFQLSGKKYLILTLDSIWTDYLRLTFVLSYNIQFLQIMLLNIRKKILFIALVLCFCRLASCGQQNIGTEDPIKAQIVAQISHENTLTDNQDGEYISVKNGHHTFEFKNGDVYVGQWRNDLRNGHDILNSADGDVYEGSWKDDKKDGFGTIKFKQSEQIYEGQWKNDEMNGLGVLKFPNGDVYEGQFKNSERNGYGVYKYTKGDVYEGQFKNNQRNGRGKYKFVDGDIYQGEFQDNQRVGKGRLIVNGQVMYDGTWRDDVFDGYGMYKFQNGNVYEGEWRDSSIHGNGTLKYANGNVYQGEWKYNKMDGHGIYKSTAGDVFEGQWKNDKSHGYGVLKFANGNVYQGQFKNNKMNGQGTLKTSGGETHSGFWKDGVLQEKNIIGSQE